MEIALNGRQEEIVRKAMSRGGISAEEAVGAALEIAESAWDDEWEPTPEMEAFLMQRLEQAEGERGRDANEVIAELKAKYTLA
jgi:hypothetical protein